MTSPQTGTIGELLRFFVEPELDRSTIDWPPDAFACAALLLEKSGAYLSVVSGHWPPAEFADGAAWTDHVRNLGKKWRNAAAVDEGAPGAIVAGWKRVLAASGKPLEFIRSEGRGSGVRNALIEILAAADEACVGAGIPGDKLDQFEKKCLDHLAGQTTTGRFSSTLCRRIPATKLCVLPKMHTPQSGITIRFLSHHLGFCIATEVTPLWFYLSSLESLACEVWDGPCR